MSKKVKTILLDLDGTVYYGNNLIPGADQAIEYFRKNEINVLFLTNNSTKTRQQIQEKLIKMGVVCTKDEIYTSGYVAALYAQNKGYKNAYIFGTNSLKQEFVEMGIEIKNDSEILVIGYDMLFDYEKLTEALQVALQAKVLIACNKEKNYPGENAKIMPGCGAMVGALEESMGRKVDYVVGKPNELMLDIICEQRKLNKDEIIVIGDTYDSDIIMSQRYGCAAVYISNTVKEDVITVPSLKEIPDMILKGIL